MGQHPQSYATEAASHFKHQSAVVERDPHLASVIRQTHFTLGISNENPYQTVNESALKPYDLSQTNVQPASNKNFIASFKVGMNDRPMHLTEAQVMYKKPPEEAYKVDKDLKANIRFIKGSHFELGSDASKKGADHFITLNEQTYQAKEAEIARLSEGVQMDLRKSHFTVGNVPEPILSTSQREFKDKSKEVKHEKVQAKGLRETHFALGDGKPDFVSMKMMHYRDPKLV